MSKIDAFTKAQEHEQDLERLRNLRPIDDTFMRRLFKNNIPLTELVLRIILQKPDLKVISVETQVDMKRVTGARSICLDAEAVDSENKKYDIEVQKASSGARPKRARYHSSIMDVENLDACEDFEDLPETYVVFITEHDVYKAGKPCYIVERINLTTGEPFDDEAHIVYVNGDYSGSDDYGLLMHDFKCSNPDDMHYDLLKEKSKYYKESKEGVAEMCKIMEDMRNEAEAKGKTEGMNALAKLMQKLFAMGRMKDAERVANDSEYREKLLKEFSLAQAFAEGVAEMCKIMEDMRNETTRQVTLKYIAGLLKNTSLTFEQIATSMNISTEEQQYYKSHLQEA